MNEDPEIAALTRVVERQLTLLSALLVYLAAQPSWNATAFAEILRDFQADERAALQKHRVSLAVLAQLSPQGTLPN